MPGITRKSDPKHSSGTSAYSTPAWKWQLPLPFAAAVGSSWSSPQCLYRKDRTSAQLEYLTRSCLSEPISTHSTPAWKWHSAAIGDVVVAAGPSIVPVAAGAAVTGDSLPSGPSQYLHVAASVVNRARLNLEADRHRTIIALGKPLTERCRGCGSCSDPAPRAPTLREEAAAAATMRRSAVFGPWQLLLIDWKCFDGGCASSVISCRWPTLYRTAGLLLIRLSYPPRSSRSRASPTPPPSLTPLRPPLPRPPTYVTYSVTTKI